MANLKLNNVIVVTESAGAATVRSGIFKAKDGTAAFTVADSTGATTFSGAVTVPTATAAGHAVTKAQLDAQGIDGITSTGSSASDTVTIAGHLTVNGTTSTINSTTLQVDDKNIDLAHSPSGSEGNDAAVDGGGITLKSSDSDKEIKWVNADDAWTFNQHLYPSADNASNLGSASKRWANIYTTDLHLNNDRGDWTIIEEEEYLSIRNNKNGKMYKFVLEEVE